jgi:hypothetical protein
LRVCSLRGGLQEKRWGCAYIYPGGRRPGRHLGPAGQRARGEVNEYASEGLRYLLALLGNGWQFIFINWLLIEY